MLVKLSIQNYALIDCLEIEIKPGFTIITGETGAGKSILLGALGLLLGQRSDTSVLLNKEKKCIVEAEFNINAYQLDSFFSENDLDYYSVLVVRREIDINRTRAFVNDSPVNTSLLKTLGDKLIDIHSQHQNLYLSDVQFQFRFIDSLAQCISKVKQYKELHVNCKNLSNQLAALKEKDKQSALESVFIRFQYDELDQAKIEENELANLEEEIEALSNTDEIKMLFGQSLELLTNDQNGINLRLKELIQYLNKLNIHYKKVNSAIERIQSAYLETKELSNEISRWYESIEHDPERLLQVKSRLDILYTLCQKHKVSNTDDLIRIKTELWNKLKEFESYESQISDIESEINVKTQQLYSLADEIHQKRIAILPTAEQFINDTIRNLGMPNGTFKVLVEKTSELYSNGSDKVSLLFSSSKQSPLQDIVKVASGGEISRLMLAVKSLMASATSLPTIIFDEVDTGVSGDIAGKMGTIMSKMSENMQVICITHLPQVAAKGNAHFKVFKTETEHQTKTEMQLLNEDERISELARMLSGELITHAAISNAIELLKK